MVAAVATSSLRALADLGRAPRILLRSSWATVNIGDIAHTSGVLRLLETHLPDAEIWLWPSKVNKGLEQLLLSSSLYAEACMSVRNSLMRLSIATGVGGAVIAAFLEVSKPTQGTCDDPPRRKCRDL